VNILIRGTGRLIKALCALTALAALLAALPYGLIRFVGDPLPRTVPTLSGIQSALTSPPQAALYIDILACLLWLCWLMLSASFLVELTYALRRVHAPRIPGLGPGQFVAAALIAAIGLGTGAAHPAAAASTSSPLPTAAPAATSAHLTAAVHALPADTSAGARESVHTVVTGDSLYSIAKQDLGNGDQWPQLYKLNADKPQPDGEELTNPDLIRPGWSIRITAPATEPGSATAPAPRTETPGTARTAAPAPAQPATGEHTEPAVPAPHTTPSRHGAPRTETAAPDSREASSARRHGGVSVSLPGGGAIGITLAVALGSALVLARRWRVRRADPRTPATEPPPPRALLAARRAHLCAPTPTEPTSPDAEITTPAGTSTGEAADTPRPEDTPGIDLTRHTGPHILADEEPDAYFDPEPGLPGALEDDDEDILEQEPPAGYDGQSALTFAAPLPPGSITTAERGGAEIPLRPTGAGLGLVGPGAPGAARAIAASVLAAGAPDRTADLARLIIPAADLAMLLETDETDLPAVTAAVPELYVTDDLPTALAEAEVNALLRARLLAETDAADLEAMAREHPDIEECPPLVVMASPERAEAGRIGALIDQGAPLRITAVLLGAHPRSATVYVDADGHTDGGDIAEWTGARMFDLPPTALTEILNLLAAAAGHASPPAAATRAELTVVPDSPAQQANEPEGTVADTTSTPATESQSAENDDMALEPAAPTGGPRLVLVDDPAEKHAEAMLAAWAERPVRISVLGPLRIEADGEHVTKLRSQARPIAALLAWKGHAGASDSQIDTTCWPDEDDPARIQQWRQDGLKSLRSRLRMTTGRKTAQFITLRDRRDYLLEPEFTTVDLWVLHALEAAASATRDPQAKARYLTRAAEFCTGTLLAEETGPDFAWADAPRVTVTGLQVSVLARLAELSADDEPDKALTALRRAAAMAEDNEHLHLRIIDLLAALGRHTEIPAQMQILTAHADSMGASVSQAARAHAARAMRTADARP
jgi:DNA-binding SARP family transcriptional activator